MQHIHRMSVVVVAAGALLAIALGAAQQESLLRDEPPGEIPVKGEGEWIPVAGEHALPAAERLVALARPQWMAAGMDPERAELLAADATQALAAIMQPDFDRYKALVMPRGMTLQEWAEEPKVLLYPDDVFELGAGSTWETKVRYFWNNPGPPQRAVVAREDR